MANTSNLKRGNTVNQGAGLEAIAANREAEQELREAAQTAPDDALLKMYEAAVVAATKGLEKWNRKGGEPSRLVIEGAKEARQLALVALDIIKARGAVTEAQRFFAEMASRLTAANLEEVPRPVGEVALT